MTCQELVHWLADYLDGELPDATRAGFEQHLAVCKHCQAFLDAYRHTIRLCAAAGKIDADLENAMPEDLLRAILAARACDGGESP